MAVTYRANRKKWGFRSTSASGGKDRWHFRWDTQQEAEEAYDAHTKRERLPATALCKAAESYIIDSSTRRSKSRVDGVGWNLQKWIVPYWGEHADIRTITPESIEAFITLHLKRVKAITVWHYVKDLRALLYWCVKKKWLEENPVKKADLTKIDKKHRKTLKLPMDRRAIERGLNSLKGPEKLYANLLGYMGLRRDEGSRVQAKDFRDMGDQVWLEVHGTKTDGSHRILPVPPFLHTEVRQTLSRLAAQGRLDAFVGSPKGKYVYDRRKLFKRFSRAAGIHITPKDMRDYFASIMDDPVTAQQMLGHTSLRTTAIYIRQVQQRMLTSVGNMKPMAPILATGSGYSDPLKTPKMTPKTTEVTADEFRKYLIYQAGA